MWAPLLQVELAGWVPPWLEGRGPQGPLLLPGYLQPWAPLGQEAEVVCATSSVDAESSGAVGSAVPQDHVLSVFQSTHLWMCRQMGSAGILVCLAAALLLPCGHLLGADGKGETGSISLHPGGCHSLHAPSSIIFFAIISNVMKIFSCIKLFVFICLFP